MHKHFPEHRQIDIGIDTDNKEYKQVCTRNVFDS